MIFCISGICPVFGLGLGLGLSLGLGVDFCCCSVLGLGHGPFLLGCVVDVSCSSSVGLGRLLLGSICFLSSVVMLLLLSLASLVRPQCCSGSL